MLFFVVFFACLVNISTEYELRLGLIARGEESRGIQCRQGLTCKIAPHPLVFTFLFPTFVISSWLASKSNQRSSLKIKKPDCLCLNRTSTMVLFLCSFATKPISAEFLCLCENFVFVYIWVTNHVKPANKCKQGILGGMRNGWRGTGPKSTPHGDPSSDQCFCLCGERGEKFADGPPPVF